MPQACEQDRQRMERWFGSIGCAGPIGLLLSHGYRLTIGGDWIKPVPSHRVSQIEGACVAFLMDEYDYGGTIPAEQSDVR